MQFQEYISEKKTNFPHKAFCLFVAVEMFLKQSGLISRNLLCPEKLLGTTPGRPQWLADKGNFWTFTLLVISYPQITLILLKLIFHSHDT